MSTERESGLFSMRRAPAPAASALLPAAPGAAWYCLHTRSRHEKKVAARCAGWNIPHFLPLRKSVRRHNGRDYVFEVPLFGGYLFCSATPDQKRLLLGTRHLARAIAVHDEEGLLDDLRQIAAAMERGAPLVPHPCLKRGARVRIVGGAFKGIEGIVSERRKRFRVVLNVRMLHQAVALEVDSGDVEPA